MEERRDRDDYALYPARALSGRGLRFFCAGDFVSSLDAFYMLRTLDLLSPGDLESRDHIQPSQFCLCRRESDLRCGYGRDTGFRERDLSNAACAE